MKQAGTATATVILQCLLFDLPIRAFDSDATTTRDPPLLVSIWDVARAGRKGLAESDSFDSTPQLRQMKGQGDLKSGTLPGSRVGLGRGRRGSSNCLMETFPHFLAQHAAHKWRRQNSRASWEVSTPKLVEWGPLISQSLGFCCGEFVRETS